MKFFFFFFLSFFFFRFSLLDGHFILFSSSFTSFFLFLSFFFFFFFFFLPSSFSFLLSSFRKTRKYIRPEIDLEVILSAFTDANNKGPACDEPAWFARLNDFRLFFLDSIVVSQPSSEQCSGNSEIPQILVRACLFIFPHENKCSINGRFSLASF